MYVHGYKYLYWINVCKVNFKMIIKCRLGREQICLNGNEVFK
jgi:hypothetical protein